MPVSSTRLKPFGDSVTDTHNLTASYLTHRPLRRWPRACAHLDRSLSLPLHPTRHRHKVLEQDCHRHLRSLSSVRSRLSHARLTPNDFADEIHAHRPRAEDLQDAPVDEEHVRYNVGGQGAVGTAVGVEHWYVLHPRHSASNLRLGAGEPILRACDIHRDRPSGADGDELRACTCKRAHNRRPGAHADLGKGLSSGAKTRTQRP